VVDFVVADYGIRLFANDIFFFEIFLKRSLLKLYGFVMLEFSSQSSAFTDKLRSIRQKVLKRR
jgi:hypothetical protein